MTTKSWALVFALSILPAFGDRSYAAMIETPLRDNVGVGGVSGGGESNPLWCPEIGNDEFRGALKSFLTSSGLLERAKGEGRYLLNAVLESINQADIGPNSVTAQVRYTLTDRTLGKVVYQESISGEYTAHMLDMLLNRTISRQARMRAVLTNVGRLTERLVALSPSQGVATILQ
jgi:hypothetical protein